MLVAVALASIIAAAVLIFAGEGAEVMRGRIPYDANCASCHGKNLQGQPDWQITGADGRFPAPPHDASGHTWHHSDGDLIAYITLGGEDALAQMGVAFNSGMPGFGDILRPDEIADILDYVKSHWPERERQYQAEQSASAYE